METLQANLVAGMHWFLSTYRPLVPQHLHGALQPAAPAIRASVQWPLQITGRRCERHGLLANGVRIRAFESDASQTADNRAAVAGLSLKQLRGISESTLAAS